MRMNKLLGLLFLLPSLGVADLSDKDIADILSPKPPVVTIYTPQTFNVRDVDWDGFSNNLIQNDKAIPGATLHILVNGYGGEVNTVVKVADSIERAHKAGVTIEMEVVGSAISGHAALLCVADKLIINNGSTIVFHNAGSYVSYIWGMIESRSTVDNIEDMIPYYTLLDKCVTKKYLTPEQLQNIKDGKKVTFIKYNNVLLSSVGDDYSNGWLNLLQQISYLVFIISSILILIGIAKRV